MIRRKNIIAVMLAASLLLTGCGSKGTENVTDYGQGAGSGSSAKDTTGQSTEGTEGKTEAGSTEGSGRQAARNGKTLSDQLGGTTLTRTTDFQIGNTVAKMEINYEVENDSPTLESYKLSAITEDRVHEAETVKALLGDSAEEVRGNISSTAGDSERAFLTCNDYYFGHGDGDPDSAEQPSEVPAWTDGEKSYLHTYQGKRNGVDYQLSIYYLKDEKTKAIGFGPKNWGDVIGDPQLTEMTRWDGDVIFVKKRGERGVVEKKPEELTDKENHAKLSKEEALTAAGKMAKEDLELRLQKEGICQSRRAGLYSENAGGTITVNDEGTPAEQLIFYPESSVDAQGFPGATINGYLLELSGSISGQDVVLRGFSEEPGLFNAGDILVAGGDVIGFNLVVSVDFDECLSEQVAILPFETAMDVFQENMAKEFDVTKAKGRSPVFKDARIGYYPVPSPENPDEYTYIPVWEMYIYAGETYCVGQVVMNAMDGSIILIDYGE